MEMGELLLFWLFCSITGAIMALFRTQDDAVDVAMIALIIGPFFVAGWLALGGLRVAHRLIHRSRK
jgi:CHASE2 domain-containing sensor protein